MSNGLVSCRDAVIASSVEVWVLNKQVSSLPPGLASVKEFELSKAVGELDDALDAYVRAYNLERVERALKIPIGTKHL